MFGYLLTAHAARIPGATALVYAGRRRTYAELNERACRLANAFRALGVRSGDRVAVLLHNCDQFFDAFFAAAKIGAIFVPINFRLPARDIAVQLEACAPSLVLVSKSLADVVRALEGQRGLPAKRFLIDDAPENTSDKAYDVWLAAQSPVEPEPAPAAQQVLMLMHTSGTTGRGKSAVFTHTIAHASCAAKIIDFGLTGHDTAVVFGPLFHAGPLMDLALPLLVRGGTVVIGPSRPFDAAHLLQTIAGHGGTVVPIHPAMLRRVVDPATPRIDVPSLRMIVTGGEMAPIGVIHAVHERFPQVAIINSYGSTESGAVTTFLEPEASLSKAGSVGREAFGVDLRIATAEDQPVARGEVGEVLVRSPFVCRGYWNQPEATTEATRNGWWHTGDLAWRDDEGYIWIAGRSKELIGSGAEGVYPIEVENAIAELPAVEEVAVIGVADGASGEAVAAFVAVRAGAQLEEPQIRRHCGTRLFANKQPRHIVLVESLPRGATGTVSRDALRALWASRAK